VVFRREPVDFFILIFGNIGNRAEVEVPKITKPRSQMVAGFQLPGAPDRLEPVT
jgi:hypothetical protein